jgi:hypothetical protein
MSLQAQVAEDEQELQRQQALERVREILGETDFDLVVIVAASGKGTTIYAVPEMVMPELSSLFRFMADSIAVGSRQTADGAVH